MPTWRDIRKTGNLRALDNVRDLTSKAIQSQYSASPHILALAEGFQNRIDPTVDLETLYREIVDIHTATGWGLDNWGRILDIGRIIEDAGTGSSITLDDEHYRLLLLYKAMANISPADVATLNRLLTELMNTGVGGFRAPAYVIEVDTMIIRWVFEYALSALQIAIFRAAGILARGAGVGWELYAINPDEVFGFDGSEMHPFNQAPFAPDTSLITGYETL